MTGLKVPIGINAPHWETIRPQRTILVVVHNVTTLNRLTDVVGVFDSDFRVQIVVTSSLSDPFSRELPELITGLGYVFVPWAQAVQLRFDLIVAASHHGNLIDLHGPLLVVSHGIGYTKYSPGGRKPATGSREVFGLSRQWLLYDGSPIADALVFSHPEQVERVAAEVPEALQSAVIAGDPCYDRILASLENRERYRRALSVHPHQRLVVVTSTWSTSSLLGSRPGLLRRLLAELPVDSYQVAAVIHPNTWQAHGPAQVRSWLADCLRAGLTLVPPLEGWRACLIAADLVIGDFGAVTCYGAAVGRPVLLAAFPDDQIVGGTAVHRLGQIAPRLEPDQPLRAQVEAALVAHDPERFAPVTELVSSLPGESARLLRKVCYDLMGLSEPAGEATVAELPTDGLTARTGPRVPAAYVACEISTAHRVARVERFAADVWPHAGRLPCDDPTHIVVFRGHPRWRLHTAADVVFTDDPAAPPPPGRTFAVVHDRGCRVRDTSGAVIEMALPDQSPVDPVVLASVAYAWSLTGMPIQALAPTITVDIAGQQAPASVRVV